MNLNVTLVAQALTFFVFILFCAKFVWPPLTKAIEARQKQIADGLQAAEDGKKSLDAAAKKADEAIAQARSRANEIVAQAEKRASQMVDEAKTTAKAEGEREKTKAHASG